MKNIGEINQKYLCTGCGTCTVVCPHDAIKMKIKDGQYYPEVEEQKCVNCIKCIDVCPGIAISLNNLVKGLWLENKYDAKLGRFISTYTGYSNDEKIRYEGASGGLVTSILIFLLKNKVVDGAILTRMSVNNPLEPESFIAYTEEEVISAQTSIYCPTSPVEVINNLKNSKESDKFVFVGLPCHIHGIRKLQEKEKWVNKKIKLTIGIFCGHGVTFQGSEFLLDKFAKGTNLIEKIQYRGKGWPSGMFITYSDKSSYYIPHEKYWASFFASYQFTPYRCLVCSDLSAELADVSLGDAWLKDIKEKDKIGTSIVVSRSILANNILEKMMKNNEINLTTIPYKKVIESQEGILARKKNGTGSRLNLFKLLLKPIPKYDQKFISTNRGFIGALFIYMNASISKTKFGQSILKNIPERYLGLNTSFVHRYGRK